MLYYFNFFLFQETLSQADTQESVREVEVECVDDQDLEVASMASDVSTIPTLATSSTVAPQACASETRRSRLKRKSTVDEELLLLARNRLANPTPSAPSNEDDHDIFGKNVACKLRKMSATQRIYAEKIINDVLFSGQVDTLNATSTVVTHSHGNMATSYGAYEYQTYRQ